MWNLFSFILPYFYPYWWKKILFCITHCRICLVAPKMTVTLATVGIWATNLCSRSEGLTSEKYVTQAVWAWRGCRGSVRNICMPEALCSWGSSYSPKTETVYLAQVRWSFAHFQMRLRIEMLHAYVFMFCSVFLALKEGSWASTRSDVALPPSDISFQNRALTSFFCLL